MSINADLNKDMQIGFHQSIKHQHKNKFHYNIKIMFTRVVTWS